MEEIRVGVLAIQGAVEEHVNSMRQLGCQVKEIRVPSDIQDIDGIILPGGESTTMAIVGESRGLFPSLKQWVQEGRPIFGTCAGMILLSDHAIKQRIGGQSLIGGLDVEVCRNYFGSQIYSCEVTIPFDERSILQNSESGVDAFNAIFIRAPAILKVGPNVKVLATLNSKPHISALAEVLSVLKLTDSVRNDQSSIPDINAIVAVQQGNILATAFHPELTKDLRWHRAFKEIIIQFKSQHL